MSYIIGVIYIHAIEIIFNIYSKSLRYTVHADVIIEIPKTNIYSTNITGGRYNRATKFTPFPEIKITIKIIIKQNNMFTNPLVTDDIGNTSLGKYIFLTNSFPQSTLVAPVIKVELKKIQGINATKRKR